MRATLPLTFGTVEDIKRKNNGNLSKQTQHFTAEAIRIALLHLRARNIPAIPDMDAIICQERHRLPVAHLLGAAVFSVSEAGRCKVNEVRYHELDYDRWENMRTGAISATLAFVDRRTTSSSATENPFAGGHG